MRKIIMSFVVILATIASTMICASCSSNEENQEVEKGEVTISEIQGDWHFANQYNYYHFSFSGNNYSYDVMEVSGGKDWVHREHGIFAIDSKKVKAQGEVTKGTEVLFDDTNIYWEDNTKTRLHIYPLGTFEKTK